MIIVVLFLFYLMLRKSEIARRDRAYYEPGGRRFLFSPVSTQELHSERQRFFDKPNPVAKMWYQVGRHGKGTHMSISHDNLAEQERIRSVYQSRRNGFLSEQYAWHRPEVLQQIAVRSRILAALLFDALGPDLSSARILDVGCGSGTFIRQLISWGADPENLTGTEFQQDRLEYARRHTAEGVQWHLGGLDIVATGSIDLVSAETVFSSILDVELRRDLAAEMWRIVRPGGYCMVYDFRYDNPNNSNVSKVTLPELRDYWPSEDIRYRTLLLAPPIARRLAKIPHLVTELLTVMLPVLQSHFFFIARKSK